MKKHVVYWPVLLLIVVAVILAVPIDKRPAGLPGVDGKVQAGVNSLYYCVRAVLLDHDEGEELDADALRRLYRECASVSNHEDLPYNESTGFVDSWGRPVHIEIEHSGSEFRVVVISSGKNGVFENGAGDDLVGRP